jgi:hypothetical protein
VLAEPFQSLVQGQQLLGARCLLQRGLIERHELGVAPSFDRRLSLGVIDQNLAHRTRRDPEEVHAVLEPARDPADHLEVGLVDQRRGCQRVIGARTARLGAGDAPQLVVHEGK